VDNTVIALAVLPTNANGASIHRSANLFLLHVLTQSKILLIAQLLAINPLVAAALLPVNKDNVHGALISSNVLQSPIARTAMESSIIRSIVPLLHTASTKVVGIQ